jgi:hypothetical protein
MKHFVGLKQDENEIAMVADFNAWFGDAQTKDL